MCTQLVGHADGLGRHLREHGVGALADLGGAHLQLAGAVLVEHDARRGRLERDGVDARLVDEAAHADAVADGARLVRVAGAVLVPAACLAARLDDVGIAVSVVGDAVERVRVAGGHEVPEAEVHRVPTLAPGDVVHGALDGELALRHAVGAHGAGRGDVGVDRGGLGVAAHLVLVRPAKRVDGVGREGVAVARVAALVGEAVAVARDDAHVVVVGDLGREAHGMARARVLEDLLTRQLYLDHTAAQLRGEPGAEWLVEDLLLVAEAAANAGLDDADVAPADAEGLAADAPHDVGDLRGRDHRDAPALHVGEAHVGLDVALAHLLRLGVDLVAVVARVVDGGLHRVVARTVERRHHVGVREHVAGPHLRVQRYGVGRHRLLHGGHDRQLLVLHVGEDVAHGPVGRHVIAGHHHGDVVAVDAHAVVEQATVGDVLVRRLHAPGVARCGEAVLGHVLEREHGLDAGNRLRAGRVDGAHPAVGDLGVHELCDQTRLGAQVVGVLGGSSRLVERIDADERTAHLAHGRHRPPHLFHSAAPLPLPWKRSPPPLGDADTPTLEAPRQL